MDDFVFAQEHENFIYNSLKPWKILISDDEKEIHTITKIVLSNFTYDNRPVKIFDAYSRKETIEILKQHKDIAVILLDVVMETDDAGLLTAQDIRETLKNNLIRIILRTGQPGSAPEKDVISKYDINDYKEKTELTTTKLFTTVMTALRSYRDLHTIEQNKYGLEKIIKSTRAIMEFKSINFFAKSVITQLASLLTISTFENQNNDAIKSLFLQVDKSNKKILATNRSFMVNSMEIPSELDDLLTKCLQLERSFYTDNTFIGYFKNDNNIIYLIYLECSTGITEIDKGLINIFSSNLSVAFNNIHLTNEILDTQSEIIETLSEVVEKRSKETSNHVLRVALIFPFYAIFVLKTWSFTRRSRKNYYGFTSTRYW